MSYQTRNFNTQQSGNTKPIWSAAGIRQMPIDPFIDGKVSNGSVLYWDRTNQYWTVTDKNVKRLTCYGQYLIWDGTTWIIVGDQNVRLGCESGKINQGNNSVAIGTSSGYVSQGSNAVAIGLLAGECNQDQGSVAIGQNAAQYYQKQFAVAIGDFAGQSAQGNRAIAIGALSGTISQQDYSIAIGNEAGSNYQRSNAIAIGVEAGQRNQQREAIAIGIIAGKNNQGSDAIAIGAVAGYTNQGTQAISIGYYAGETNQGQNSISVGWGAGGSNQGANSIAIGTSAGYALQGTGCVAIGYQAGFTGQHANTIILSATGGALNSDKTGALFVNPIALRGTGTNEVLYYDSGNSEVFRGPQGFQNYASGFFSNFINTSTGPTGSGPYSGPFVSPFDIITTERVIYNNIANNFIIQKTGKYLINWTVQAGLEPNPSTDFGYIDFYLRVNGFQTLPTLVIQLQSSSAMIRSGANTCILSLNSGDYLDIWTSVFTGPAGWIFATSITIQQL